MKIKISSYEKSSLILFALMMGTNVCNYLFQIVVGNMMDVESFAQVNTTLAMIGVLSIPTTIITIICARYTAINTNQDDDAVAQMIRYILKFSIIVTIVFVFFCLFTSNILVKIWRLDSLWYIFYAAIITILTLFFSVTSGTLQGQKRFSQYGIQTLITAVSKMVLSVLLITLGFNVYGVLLAITIGICISILYGILHVGKFIRLALIAPKTNVINVSEFWGYAGYTIIAQGCVIALTNGDILMVKAFFSDLEAGYYSSAMVIGKIAMYVSTAVIATLFPTVVEMHQKRKNTTGVFGKALLYGGGVSIVCSVGLIVFGKMIICILFGAKYAAAVNLLLAVSSYVVPLTFVSIVMNYLLAINQIGIFDIVLVVACLTIVLLGVCFHSSIEQLMMVSGVTLWIVFLIGLIIVNKKSVNRKEDEDEVL